MLTDLKLKELIVALDNIFDEFTETADGDPVEIASVYLASALSKMRHHLDQDQIHEFRDEMTLLMDRFTLDTGDFVHWLNGQCTDENFDNVDINTIDPDPTIH